MSKSRGISSGGGLLTVGLIGTLAVVAILLAVYALRTAAVPGAGLLPGPIPTWGAVPSTAPASTPTPGVVDPNVSLTGLMDFTNGGLGIRASRGECSGVPATVQVTNDGGASWMTASFGTPVVAQVLSVRAVDDAQFDVVATTGPNCDLTLLTSYTQGEFWAAYPERLAEVVWVDPRNGTVHSGSITASAPCPAPRDAQSLGSEVLLRCDDGLYQSGAGATAWTQIVNGGVMGFDAPSSPGGSILVAKPAQDCDGVQLSTLTLETSEATAVGCIPSASGDGPGQALAATTSTLYWWDGSRELRSVDGGVTWQ